MHRRMLLSLVALFAVTPMVLGAQVNVTPLIGGYVPAGDWGQIKAGTETVAAKRDGTLSLGINLELGSFRGSVAYASGTTIRDGNRQDIGKGNMFGFAGDVVIRPLMRMVVQPYLVAGAGQKFYKLDQMSAPTTGFDTRRFAWHGGLGADVMIGNVGIATEVTDFVSKGERQNWNVHDAFAMVGVRLRVP